MKRTVEWLINLFSYSYEQVWQVVSGKQSIQRKIDLVDKGIGYSRMVRKFRWPWQHPDKHRRGIVFIAPGKYRGAITMKPYVHIKGSGNRLQRPGHKETKIMGGMPIVTLADHTSLQDLTLKQDFTNRV